MIRLKNKWRFTAALIAAGILLTVSGCSGGKKTDRVKMIQDAGVLKVAIVDTNSRYTSLEGQTPVGLEPELVQTIAGALGVAPEYQIVSKDEALQAVSGGLADMAIGCINGSSRLTTEYQLSTAYGKGFFYAVTKKGDYTLTVGAFEDSSVGVDRGLDEDSRTQIYKASGVTVNEYGSAQEAAADIKDGRIRAYICYEDQAKALLEDSSLQVQNVANLEPEEFVILTGKGETTLGSGIDVLIRQFLEKE